MPDLAFNIADHARPTAHLPRAPLVNCYVEKTDGGPQPIARIPRPGLTQVYNVGLGPIVCTFSEPGVFGGDLFTVSGAELYRGSDLIGSVAYGPAPQMAASHDELALVTGGNLYIYNGSTLTWKRTFDDGYSLLPYMTGVAILSSQFYYPTQDSDTFYYSDLNKAGVINALSFATAETSPDPIVRVQRLGDELVFFGLNSTEWWAQTGLLDQPIALSQGRTYARGCAAEASVVSLDNALFWLGDDRIVYRTSSIPVRISTSTVEDALARCEDISACKAFSAYTTGHLFYVLSIPGQTTFVYDCQTQQWAEWASYERTAFLGQTGTLIDNAGAPGITYIGSAIDGRVWKLDNTRSNDDGQPMEVMVSAAIWIKSKNIRCDIVALACVRGVGALNVPDPLVEACWSDDGGRTFGSWRQAQLGGVGGYVKKAIWRRMGLMNQPGRLLWFRVTDSVPFVVEGGTYNEARP